MGVVKDEHVGIAFALVVGAGLATAVGGSVVFFPSLVRLASRRTLAGSLALSAGVMIYVSFVEILQKSRTAFEDAAIEKGIANAYATLSFFAGVALMLVSQLIATACETHTLSFSVCLLW